MGWAELASGEPAEKALVELEPAAGDAMSRAGLATSTTQRRRTTTTNARGFFQLTGLEAGPHRLRIRLDGHGLVELPQVALHERDEVALADPVIVPYFPHADVTVRPPTDPQGRPWTLLVTSLQRAAAMADVDALGSARFPMLPPGTYRVLVMDADGASFATEQVALTAERPHHEMTLELKPVAGTLRLGGDPVSGLLYFVGAMAPSRFASRRARMAPSKACFRGSATGLSMSSHASLRSSGASLRLR